MKAFVLRTPGGPEALEFKEVPDPTPVPGEVTIRVHAFGLNRAEHFTRRGLSPDVSLPRIIGIECVGEVVCAPESEFTPGQKVAAMMGGMGREYDGSYAEMTRVPAAHVFPLDTTLPWETLGALPEMAQTTLGSLEQGLEVERAESILVRGGTSSIGMLAIRMAKARGLTVLATSRSEARASVLRSAGADHCLVDDGAIAQAVRSALPGGVDRVLELIGTKTLKDSLRAARPRGIVCMTGILGGEWSLSNFQPMTDIPTGVKLTAYSGGSGDISPRRLQEFVSQVEKGELCIPTDKVFDFVDLVEAHRYMDANKAAGKIVVRVP